MASTSVVFDILARDQASAKFDHLGNSVDGSTTKMGRFNDVMKTAGKAAAYGLGAGLVIGATALVGMTKNAIEDEAAQRKLAIAMENSVGATDKQIASVENWITKAGLATGVTDDEMRPAFQRLVQATGDVGEAQRQMGIAMDVSAGTGKSLKTVSEALMKANNGTTASLSKLGLKTKDAEGNTLSLKDALKEMSDTFGGQAAAKAGTLEGKMDRLKLIFDETKESIGAKLIPIVSDFADVLINKVVPNIGPVASKLGDIAKIGWDKLRDGAGAAKEFFDKVKNSDKVRDAVQGIADAAGKIKSGFEKAKAAVDGIDFGNLDAKKLGTMLGTALAVALDSLLSLAGKVTEKLGALFAKVDWVGLGIEMGKQVPALLTGLAVGILAFDPLPILEGLADHWQEVLLAVLAIAFAPAKIAGGLGKLLAKIPFVGKFLEHSVQWLNELGGKVLNFGQDLFSAMWKGFTGGAALPGAGVVAKVLAGIKGIPGAVKGFIDDLQVKLGVWALDAFEAIGRGARNAIGGILSFVGSIPGKILNAVGDVAKLLFPKGVAAIEGMAEGLRGRWENVVTFFKGVPGRVTAALPNMLEVLKGAGAAVIQGLINGINSMIGPLSTALSAITSLIPKKKGPPSKDAVLLKPAGVALMDGLIAGIDKGKVKLKTVLEKLTGFISKHQDKLATLLDKRQAIVDSFKGFSSSLFGADIAGGEDENGRPKASGLQALLDFQSNQRAKAEQLKGDVGTLIGKGISDSLLKQLQDAGEAGEEQIHALASATEEQIKQVNADNAATQLALQEAGMAASKALGVEAAIKQEERDIKLAQGIKGALKELLDEQDKNTVVELHLDGHKILWSLKKIKRQNGGKLGLGDRDDN
jgi:hypothetical protein